MRFNKMFYIMSGNGNGNGNGCCKGTAKSTIR